MAQTQTAPFGYFYPNRRGARRTILDEALNDPDKTITVPAGKSWQVLSVLLEYTADANAGNRQIELQVLDADSNLLGISDASAVQTASSTEYYHFLPGLSTPVETFATEHYLPYPGPQMLFAGDQLVFDDTADVAAGDDTAVRIAVLEFEAT